jgi:hypothetical protein
MPSGSLLGVHVKASLVKAGYHGKAYQKVQLLLPPPSGPVEELLLPGSHAPRPARAGEWGDGQGVLPADRSPGINDRELPL